MGRYNLPQIPILPDEIKEAGLDGNLVLFVGAGISRLAGLPSWSELAEKVLLDLQQENVLNFSDIEQMRDLDPRTKLSIAELHTTKIGLSFYISQHLNTASQGTDIYRYLNNIGCAYVTTNYDELLVPQNPSYNSNKSTSTRVRPIIGSDPFWAANLNTPGTVVHLHGSVSDPPTIIATTKDYLEHYNKEEVKHLLGELFTKKTVLFIGYSLEEKEILEHILRHGRAGQAKRLIRKLFVLQGFYSTQRVLYEDLCDYYADSFGVYLIGFSLDYKKYEQQVDILKTWSEIIMVRPPSIEVDLSFMDEVLNA